MDRTIERELAEQQAFGDFAAFDHSLRRQNTERDRQVEGGAGLPHIGGGEIHGDAMGRELEAGIADSRSDAVAAFADAGIGKADHREAGESERDVDLNLNEARLDAEDGGRADAGKHWQM
jgi:hypothetical protein